MEPEFALRMEPAGDYSWLGGAGQLQWSRSLHSGWNSDFFAFSGRILRFNGAGVCTPDGTSSSILRISTIPSFNGAGVCTPDGTPNFAIARRACMASMEPEFALRMEPAAVCLSGRLWIFNGAGVCTPDGTRRPPFPVFCRALQWSRSLHSGWNRLRR